MKFQRTDTDRLLWLGTFTERLCSEEYVTTTTGGRPSSAPCASSRCSPWSCCSHPPSPGLLPPASTTTTTPSDPTLNITSAVQQCCSAELKGNQWMDLLAYASEMKNLKQALLTSKKKILWVRMGSMEFLTLLHVKHIQNNLHSYRLLQLQRNKS